MSNSLWPREAKHIRPPCPSPTPGVHPNPCPWSRWCHPAISSSVIPFSSCPQAFPASGSFQMSQLFASGGQTIGVSASTSVLPMNTQDWSPSVGSHCSPKVRSPLCLPLGNGIQRPLQFRPKPYNPKYICQSSYSWQLSLLYLRVDSDVLPSNPRYFIISIFSTQVLNSHLLCLLPYRWILYLLSHWGGLPNLYFWAKYLIAFIWYLYKTVFHF